MFISSVAPSKGLFHKAISQSGYTTSVPYEIAYNKGHKSTDYVNSEEIINRIYKNKKLPEANIIRNNILSMSAYEFYSYYPNDSFREIP